MRVFFVGRLASLGRREAAGLVVREGGEVREEISPQLTHVVIGEGGWPLSGKGKLPAALRRAMRLVREGAAVQIVREQEFFALLTGRAPEAVVGRFTLGELVRLSGVPGERLRAWQRRGWIEPADTRDGVAWFGYDQLARIRALARLVSAGISPRRIGRSLAQLKTWLPQAELALWQLADISRERRLATRTNDGRLTEPQGQLLIDFGQRDGREGEAPAEPCIAIQFNSSKGSAGASPSPSGSPSQSDSDLWAAAIADERAGRMAEAAEGYRELLERRPSADLWFNLGNTLFSLGTLEAAADAYRQALALDAGFVESWNNLGGTLMDLAAWPEAEEALRRALRLQPAYADAHYNLADLLAAQGRWVESRHHRREFRRAQTATLKMP